MCPIMCPRTWCGRKTALQKLCCSSGICQMYATLFCKQWPMYAQNISHLILSYLVGILSQPAWPPSSPNVGIPKKEKKIFCILGYSKHIIFHEKLLFFVIGDLLCAFWWQKYVGDKIPAKLPFCMVVVWKSWDLARPTPPPFFWRLPGHKNCVLDCSVWWVGLAKPGA